MSKNVSIAQPKHPVTRMKWLLALVVFGSVFLQRSKILGRYLQPEQNDAATSGSTTTSTSTSSSDELRAEIKFLQHQLAERNSTVNDLKQQLQKDQQAHETLQAKWDAFFSKSAPYIYTPLAEEKETSSSNHPSPSAGDAAVPRPTHAETPETPATVTVSPPATTIPASYQDFHRTETAILPLADWEQASLEGLQSNARPIVLDRQNRTNFAPLTREQGQRVAASCQPPDGIRPTCCLGSFSAGGGIGVGNRWQCDAAFAKETGQWEELQQAVATFFQENPIPPSTQDNHDDEDNMECDICRIVELARRHNHLNITMFGDSMHHQVMEGMVCELQRRGYILENWITEERRWDGRAPFRDMGSIEIAQFRSPHWSNTSTTTDDDSNQGSNYDLVTIKYYGLYLMPMTQNSDAMAEEMLSTTQVLILGMGLHWTWMDGGAKAANAYAPAVMDFVQQAATNATSRVELIIQRETTAQHFDVPGGDFKEWNNKKGQDPSMRYECVAHVPGESTNWREKYLDNAMSHHNFTRIMAGPSMPPLLAGNPPEVITLPYHNFTQRFPTMHPNGGNATLLHDCTHYCSSPFIYMTLWRSIRLAMDRKYG